MIAFLCALFFTVHVRTAPLPTPPRWRPQPTPAPTLHVTPRVRL